MAKLNPYTDRKPQLILDFDDTLANTLPTVVKYLNLLYETNYTADDIQKWDFTDKFPLIEEDIKRGIIINPFESDWFWEHLTLKNGVLEALKELDGQYYDIFIVSKGEPINLEKKKKFIKWNIWKDGIKAQFKPIPLEKSKSLSFIRNDGSVAIDDNENYLKEINTTYKFLFEAYPNREWNSTWQGEKINKWDRKTIDMLKNLAKDYKYKG